MTIDILSLFKEPLFNRGRLADAADPRQRLAIYQREHDEPEYAFRDPGVHRIDVHALVRDFVPDCAEGSDEGYVPLTKDMGERAWPFQIRRIR